MARLRGANNNCDLEQQIQQQQQPQQQQQINTAITTTNPKCARAQKCVLLLLICKEE
jgi:hypothetical protein